MARKVLSKVPPNLSTSSDKFINDFENRILAKGNGKVDDIMAGYKGKDLERARKEFKSLELQGVITKGLSSESITTFKITKSGSSLISKIKVKTTFFEKLKDIFEPIRVHQIKHENY